MSLWTSVKFGISLLLLALLAACTEPGPMSPLELQATGATLEQAWARPGERVAVVLNGAAPEDVSVAVAGNDAAILAQDARSLAFEVPEASPAGPQAVELRLGDKIVTVALSILGADVVADEVVLVVAPGTTAEALAERLAPLPYSLLEGPRSLGATRGPCSGELVRLKLVGVELPEALGAIAQRGGDDVWHSDPESGYSSGAVDHLGAVGAREAHARGSGGAGTVIAVLDTGVSPHPELDGRLLSADGYDFVDDDGDASDEETSAGHGTPIAVLAAGSSSGVAPAAEILPVRVCDEDGSCRVSDVIEGLCYALTTAEERLGGGDRLVINLSLGGDTPSATVRSILADALAGGTLVAAAGGNDGERGSPRHYPAAYDLPGLVAVAAVARNDASGAWEPASFSTRGDYLDLAAPGADLGSGTPSGGERSDYRGTSFATGLVSGALALWREAEPGATALDAEADLVGAARPLPFAADAVGAGLLDLSSRP